MTGRVLHVLASNERRGAEVFAADLADALESFGWEPTLVSVSVSASSATVPARPLGHGLSLPTLHRLRSLSRTHDVVVAHGSSTLPACALACSGIASFVYRSIGDPAYWSASGVKRWRTTWLLNRAHTVVSLFPSAKEVLVGRGVTTKIEVIPRAVRCRDFRPVDAREQAQARSELGMPLDRAVVLYLGALSTEKRPDRAVDLAAARPDIEVVIVGDGPLRRDVEAHAAPLSNVQVHSPTSDSRRYLAAADVLILPSETEGTPGVAIEAGLTGLPVVGMDVGGMSTVIEDGVTGILVACDDVQAFTEAVDAALIQDPAMGRAARKRCLERFDIEAVARQWATVINAAARPRTGA